jgi:hypothetical protein
MTKPRVIHAVSVMIKGDSVNTRTVAASDDTSVSHLKNADDDAQLRFEYRLEQTAARRPHATAQVECRAGFGCAFSRRARSPVTRPAVESELASAGAGPRAKLTEK